MLWLHDCYIRHTLHNFRRQSVGVPQGSVLGPMLFMLYINDLPRVVSNSSVSLYADDTLVYATNPSLECLQSLLQKDLDEISKWMLSNRLSLNLTKTVSMLIGVPQKIKDRSLNLSIAAVQLSNVRSYRYLGMTIDNHLSWKEHIQILSRQMSHQFFLFTPFVTTLTESDSYGVPCFCFIEN